MKTRTKFIIYILITGLLLFSDSLILAQETITTEIKPLKLYVGLSAGPSINKIKFDGISSISGMTSTYKNSISGSIDIGYMLSRNFGIISGLEYSSFNPELFLGTYSNKFNTIDSDIPPEPYERRISGSDIHETQKITFMSLPLCLNIQIPLTKKFGIFIQAGANFSFPVSDEYSSRGTFSYSGYYPAYNVVLQNLPAYGFVNDAAVSFKGKLEIVSPVISGIGVAGFQCFITDKLQLALGANYSRSLTNISKSTSPETFQLSWDSNQISSMMGGSRKTETENLGLRLSVRYYFR